MPIIARKIRELLLAGWTLKRFTAIVFSVRLQSAKACERFIATVARVRFRINIEFFVRCALS